MEDHFDNWNKLKKNINTNPGVEFTAGEVWMTSLGKNVGVEEDGKGEKFFRPILVLKRFNEEFFVGVPLSTTEKEGEYYLEIEFKGGVSKVLLSHVKTLDSKRLQYRMGKLGVDKFETVKTKIRNLFS